MRLELAGITKRFGSLVANDDVSLTVEPGEIHCLLGENGAGKSTLMNVLFGLLHADEGQVRIDGATVRFADPGDAVRHGIGMVHQHFMLVPVFTVAENVVLGFEPTRPGGVLDRRRARADVRRLSAKFGLEVDPDAVVETLPVGVQQRVEILKALQRDARLLILDEPTAVLTPQETEALFAIMGSLKASGRSILFITHKLKEVLRVADRITVMRLGRVVGSTVPAETDEAALATLMVGRDVELVVAKGPSSPAQSVLELVDLTVVDERGVTVVDHVSLDVRAGEIVALAGVQGNGQTELAEAITGLRPVSSGTVRMEGRDLTNSSPRAVILAGTAHVPEDRQQDGLVLSMSIAENLTLDIYDIAPFARHGVRDLAAVRANGERRLAEFDIRATSAELKAGALSGGNQQKVVVARELSRPIKVLLASQPTRGLDVGSIEYVHRRIVAERDQGTAVLIVSSELDEVLALGDRIAVMFRGRLIGVVDPSAGREAIGLMMAGVEQPAPSSAALSGGSVSGGSVSGLDPV
jgi:simple sugar transport system ATP-binding protein